MPVVQRRPHIIELLNIAVGQQGQINETRTQLLLRPPNIWYQNETPGVNYSPWEQKKIKLHNWFTQVSRVCETIHQSKGFSWARRVAWPVAFSVMSYEAPLLKPDHTTTGTVFFTLDVIVNSFFMVESIFRLCGLFIRTKIERACKREMSFASIFIKSGILDIIIIAMCFGYGLTTTGLWLRLARLVLITASAIELFPQIDVLMSGLSSGVRSVFFTIVVFVLILVFFASLGHHLFSKNDPLHFHTFTDSFLTFFQMSTFDNWLQIYEINAHGCNNYPADYGLLTFTADKITTPFGVFDSPECSNPHARPIFAAFVFFTFALVEGYVLVSMNLAAVAIGINEKLEILRRAHVYGDDEEAEALSRRRVDRGGNDALHTQAKEVKAAKLLGTKNHTKELTVMLQGIWDFNKTGLKKPGSHSIREIPTWSMKLKFFVVDGWYEFIVAAFIFADACLQINDELDNSGNFADPLNIPFHWIFQAVYLLDISIQVFLNFPNFKSLLSNSWFMFSVVTTGLNFIVLAEPNSYNPEYSMVASVRLFRLLSVLWTFRFLADLRVIMHAFYSSYKCLIYVAVLVTIFLCYFSIGGILLFKIAAPYYFSSLGAALRTLFDSMTQDGWSQVMRACMYGCANFGFNSGFDQFDKTCLAAGDGRGVGYWAPIFFVIFEILSSMVLVSLLVGVIITSLELLREDLIEEELIMSRVKVVQRRYHLDSAQVTMMLHLFERIDGNNNGSLMFEELVPLLNAVQMNTSEQFEFFLRVDTDRSGQINFAEFCEMVALMGLGRKNQSSSDLKIQPKAPEPMAKKIVDAVLSGANDILNEVASSNIKPNLSFKMRSAKERAVDRNIIDSVDSSSSKGFSTGRSMKSPKVVPTTIANSGPTGQFIGDHLYEEGQILPGILMNSFNVVSTKYQSQSIREIENSGVRLFSADDANAISSSPGGSKPAGVVVPKLIEADEEGSEMRSERTNVDRASSSIRSPYDKQPPPSNSDVLLSDVI